MDYGLVGELDVAILCVIAFVLFFLGLVYHLRQEDKREGYPLETGNAVGGVRRLHGFPPVPKPKTFDLPHGQGQRHAPRQEPLDPAGDVRGLDGFPIAPAGDPLADGIGAAAWQDARSDKPDLNVEGELKIVPLREWDEYHVAAGDPDPRGWSVLSADGRTVGTVTDLWFNRAEFFLRYLEFDIGEERTRLLPLFFCRVDPTNRQVHAFTLVEDDLRRVPVTGSRDHITVREEDRLNGFYAGGLRYSRPVGAG